MTVGKKSLKQNLCFRLAGLLLIVVGGFGLKLLYRVVNLPPAHEATMAGGGRGIGSGSSQMRGARRL